MPKTKQTQFLLVLASVAIVIVLGFFTYANALKEMLVNSAYKTLDEVLQQQKLTFVSKLEGEIDLLQVLSAQVTQTETPLSNVSLIQPAMNATASESGLHSIVVTGLNGIGINNLGQEADIRFQGYFLRALEGETFISEPYPPPFVSGLVVAIGTPVYRDGRVDGVLAGYLELNELDGVFSSSFNGNGHAYISTTSGKVITKTTSEFFMSSDNWLEDFKDAVFIGYDDYQAISQNMRKGLGGRSDYSLDGHRRLMRYEPLGINNWYIVSIAGYNYITSEFNRIMLDTIVVAVGVSLLFFAVFFLYLRNQKKMQAQIKQMDERVNLMFDAAPIGCTFWTKDYEVIDCNEANVRMFGLKYKQDYMDIFFSLSPETQPNGENSEMAARAALRKAFEEGQYRFEWMHRTISGEPLPAEITLIRINYEGRDALAGYARDLREQKAMLAEIDSMLQNAELDEQCFRHLAAHTNMAVVEWKYSLEKVRKFTSYEELFSTTLLGKKDYNDVVGEEMIHPEDRELHRQTLKVAAGMPAPSIKIRLKCKDGSYRWCQHPVVTVYDKTNNPYKSIGFFEDIHDKVLKEETMRQKSQTDTLTRLYNKGAVKLLITDALESAESRQKHAFICVDLDNFKSINDSFGHLYGDEVLIEISGKIKKLFRSSDILGRFGGDEFLLFVRNLPSLAFAQNKVDALCKSIHKTYRVGDVEHTVSASIGVSIYPDDGTGYDELYKKADEASYRIKNHGKNGFAFYSAPQEPSGAE